MGSEKRGRRVVANVSVSLDGRVTGPDGDYDMGWVAMHAVSDTAREHLLRQTKDATTVVLGRKNYEGFGGFWPTVATNEEADPRDREYSGWLDSVEKVAISSTLQEATWQNSRVTDEDPAKVVSHLRREPGGDILVLASVSIIQALLAAGEVDRIIYHVAPEIVGGGRPLFTDDVPRSSWRLSESQATESGSIYLILDRVEE
jgi:dihydrofolate reductase